MCLELVKIASERVRARIRRTSDSKYATLPGKENPDEDKHKQRVLSRFRNAFVNVARPMLAFAQPVAAEVYHYRTESADAREESSRRSAFTLWDVIEVCIRPTVL